MSSIVVSNKNTLSFIDYPSKNKSALTYFLYGCGFHCPDCQNKELQDRITYNRDLVTEFTDPGEFVDYLLDNDNKQNRGNRLVVFQGGDPLFKENRDFIRDTIKISASRFTGLRFCIYTGFQIEIIQQLFSPESLGINTADKQLLYYNLDKIMSSLQFVKCGEYDKTLPNPNKIGKRDGKIYFATTNQKLYKYNPTNLGYELISENGVADLALLD